MSNTVLTGKYKGMPAAHADSGTYIGVKEPNGLITFKGVKFASAKRWQRAVPEQSSGEIFEAFENGFEPVQLVYDAKTQCEEALYCNVFTNPAGKAGKKPVLVYIPVGGGVMSNGRAIDPTTLLLENPDMIVVVTQARISYFGCINLSVFDDYEKYKNDYLYSNNLTRTDLITALEWVQKNIEAFGGDRDNVTIYGRSMGGTTVSTMLLVEDSPKYYKRIIMESGVALDRISLTPLDESIEAARKFIDYTGVSTIEEALKLTPQQILDAQDLLTRGAIGAYLPDSQSKMFATVIDNVLVFDDYWDTMIKNVNKYGVRIYVSTTNGEYDGLLSDESPAETLKGVINSNWGKLDPARGGAANAPELIEGYVRRGAEKYGRDEVRSYLDLKNDINQKCSACFICELFASIGARAYLCSYQWSSVSAPSGRVKHGGEKGTTWGNDSEPPENVGKALRRGLAGYVLYGDPNEGNEYLKAAGVDWKPYDAQNKWTMAYGDTLSLDAGQRVDDVWSLLPLFKEFSNL